MLRLLTVCIILTLSCPLVVTAQLRVDFTADRSAGCSPLVVHYTASLSGASGGGIAYSWDLGNGNSTPVAGPEAVYTSIGTYTVTLTVSEGGQTATASHVITVYPPPQVSFTPSSANVCGTPVTFTGNSDGGAGASGTGSGDRTIVSWLWDFGDGSTFSGGPAAMHTYSGTGAVGATLTVTDNLGCTASLTQPAIVQVLPPLNAGFTASAAVLCTINDPVSFTNTSSGPGTLSYNWDFGDGTSSTATNPQHVYSAKGDYTVRLTVSNPAGCTAVFAQPEPLNVADYSTDFSVPSGTLCAGAWVSFGDNSNPAATTRVWQIDGSTAAYYDPFSTILSAGTHTVTLNNTFGTCRQSTTKTIVVNPLPPSTPFTVTTQKNCPDYSATFTDQSVGGFSRSWNFNYSTYPPTNFAPGGASVTQPGFLYGEYYTVALQLTSMAGCSTIITEPLELSQAIPTVSDVNGGSTSSCNQPITKTYSYNYAGTLQSFSWDLGDGTTSTAVSPTHTWNQPGIYSVIFHYVDANGCVGQLNVQTIVISAPPSLDFTATPTTACVGSTVTFSSPGLSGNVLVATWNYGDGGSSGSGYHSYSSAGTYTVSLSVVTYGGCTATTTKTQYITVLPSPGAYMGHSNTCDGTRNVVTFQETSTSASTITWDFGDGQTTTSNGATAQLQHTYSSTGMYHVGITAGNGTCTVQNSDVVYVLLKQTPVLKAVSASVCANGSLDVQLTVERNPWEMNTGYYYYDYTPLFYYGDGQPYKGTVTFTNPGQPYSNGAFGWTLNGFQAGESSLYVVITSFGFNCTDVSNTIPLTVHGTATPALKIVSDGHCFGQAVVLQDLSTVGAGNSIVSGSWDFGDGNTQPLTPGSTVSHVYSDPGSYLARVTVQDAAGCTVSSGADQGMVRVNGPKAAFSASATTLLEGGTLYVYNYSNAYGATAPVYTWDFGDGSGGLNSYNASHQYNAPGTFVVSLSAFDAGTGCGNQVQQTVVVQYFNSHFQMRTSYVGGGCPPALVQFTNTSYGYSSLSWDFGDGDTAGNVQYPSHVYTAPGTYTVKLSLYGPAGLLGVYTDEVVVIRPSAGLTTPDSSVCDGGPVQLQGGEVSGKGFLFDFGDGTVSGGSDSTVTHVYTVPGSYVARLVVTDSLGCSVAAGDSLDITIHPNPVIKVTPAAPVVCLGGSVVLQASGALGYNWSPLTGLDTADAGGPVASPVVSTLYTVVGIDANGCRGADTLTVKVQQPEKVRVSPDSVATCIGNPVTLTASGADVYNWIGDTAGSGAASISVRPSASVVYRVVGSDTYGCFHDTATVAVTVLPEQAHLANAFTPNGDGRNDRFGVLGIGEVRYLAVYDRWGERIFEKHDFFAGDRGSTWDGTIGGQPAPTGVYVYFVEMTCPTGGTFQQKGTVILVR